MESGPTIYTTPRYIAAQAARLRRAALAHVLLEPIAIGFPVLLGARGLRIGIIGAPLFIALWALLQLAPTDAPRTLRRRYRRLTRQIGLGAFAIFCFQVLTLVVFGKLSWLLLGAVALNLPVLVLLAVSLPVYLAPRPEDLPRP